MKVRTIFTGIIMVSLIFLGLKAGFCQDSTPAQTMQTPDIKSDVVQGGAVPVETAKQEPEAQWVWGEVVTVDLQNKMVFVKYLDYESDQEKEMSVAVDDKTTFENVKSMDELKPKDTVSVDYVTQDGKATAKNISVEKAENQPVPQVQAPQKETKPQDITPPAQAPSDQQAQPAVPSGN